MPVASAVGWARTPLPARVAGRFCRIHAPQVALCCILATCRFVGTDLPEAELSVRSRCGSRFFASQVSAPYYGAVLESCGLRFAADSAWVTYAKCADLPIGCGLGPGCDAALAGQLHRGRRSPGHLREGQQSLAEAEEKSFAGWSSGHSRPARVSVVPPGVSGGAGPAVRKIGRAGDDAAVPRVSTRSSRSGVSSPNCAAAAEFLQAANCDIALACCKHILKPEIFEIPRQGTFVMHPGICPEYRNAHGCFWAMVNGDLSRVGMTLLKVDKGIDNRPGPGPLYRSV